MATYTNENIVTTSWINQALNSSVWATEGLDSTFSYLCTENMSRIITEDGAKIIFNISPVAQIWTNEIKN